MVNRGSIFSFRSGTAGLAFLLLWWIAGPGFAATIEVSLDRNPASLNESFTVIFSADEEPDDDPDFSPLEQDFDILGQSQSNQVSIVNGRVSRSIQWQLTVMARRAGTLAIPPVAFGRDRSRPFSVTVTLGAAPAAGTGGEDLLLEVEAAPQNPYVQAQVIYTVRVLSRNRLGGGQLDPPRVGDALVEKLGEDRQYFTARNGVQYQVTERRYALFPQKSGHLTIEPLRLEARTTPGQPFFGLFNQGRRTQRVVSEPVELEVRPVPKEFAGRHWLPATGLVLEDSWAKGVPQTASGEPVTRTLTLRARGATVGVLPELGLALPAGSGNTIKQYPDQPLLNEDPRGDGLAAVRQEKTALIVSQPGTYRLPAVEIPWWNTETDRPETARLPERILTVLPSAHGLRPETPAAPAPAAEPGRTPEPLPAAPGAGESRPSELWFWLTLAGFAGWAATAVAWWASRRPRPGPLSGPARAEPAPAGRALAEAVLRACRANDPVAARRALAAWAEDAGTSLAELERRGGEFGRALGRLNRSLYAPETEGWQGQALADRFRALVEERPGAAPKTAPAELESLYKL
jgi:hypothetical protein